LVLYEERRQLVDPDPEPQPRRIPLETLAQLDALPSMNDERVAMVWGWKNEHGQPDRDRVARVRLGEEKAPTETILPPIDDRPKRKPHGGIIFAVSDWLLEDRG